MMSKNLRRNTDTAYEIIEKAVKEYWEKERPQDVIAFFMMKYEHEETFEWYGELVECTSDTNYDDVLFHNDFCEGQTCVENVYIVPLQTVIDYYFSHVASYEIENIQAIAERRDNE